MFQWNYGAYKCSYNASNSVSDEEIKEVLERAGNIFYESIENILNILQGGCGNE